MFDSLTVMEKRIVLAKAIENLKEGNSILVEKNESQRYEIKAIKKYEVEWNKKLTMSFACLVFFFIGAPLGAIIRKGGLRYTGSYFYLFLCCLLCNINFRTETCGRRCCRYICRNVGSFIYFIANRHFPYI